MFIAEYDKAYGSVVGPLYLNSVNGGACFGWQPRLFAHPPKLPANHSGTHFSTQTMGPIRCSQSPMTPTSLSLPSFPLLYLILSESHSYLPPKHSSIYSPYPNFN
ncbi:hypothetical protein TorRG33x02_052220 [Trema orientale]|uniref:Uncharacterized protein n=1 Tax=Trema orientale TaxID=63057 RepID=A0A2P5FMG3_TREOI|nr:hypothetical protein TorRG33x02_052220 [Trema orientale]